MKQYVIDELRPDDHQKIKAYMDAHFEVGSMEGLYWMALEENILNATQAEHDQCRPFYVALELTPDKLTCEFLMRTHHRIRCDCIGYADEVQRNWIIQSVDAIFEKLRLFS